MYINPQNYADCALVFPRMLAQIPQFAGAGAIGGIVVCAEDHAAERDVACIRPFSLRNRASGVEHVLAESELRADERIEQLAQVYPVSERKKVAAYIDVQNRRAVLDKQMDEMKDDLTCITPELLRELLVKQADEAA